MSQDTAAVRDRLPSLDPDRLFMTGGRLGELMQSHDWSTSVLGPPCSWPQSLRSVVGLMLGSKFPMFVAWGSELGFLYNDGYAEILGAKHPGALGSRFGDIWAEIWSDISPLVDTAMRGEAIYRADLPLFVERKGFKEQAWFTFSYSPVRNEAGEVAGMYCVVAETTGQVLANRRRDALLALDLKLRNVSQVSEISFAASELLAEAVGAARAGYGSIDADAGTITVAQNWNAPQRIQVEGTHDFRSYGSYVDDLRRGHPVVIADVSNDVRTLEKVEAFGKLGVRAFVDVPVVEEGRAEALMFVHSAAPRIWTTEEVDFVRDVAERTHGAIARRNAERELLESEGRLRLVQAAAKIGSFDKAADHQAASISPEYASLYGLKPEKTELPYEGWLACLHPDERDRIHAETRAAVEDESRTRLDQEFRIVRADTGEERWISSRTELKRNQQGQFIRSIGAQWDITDRRARQEELRRVNETLELRVAERTAELAESEQRFRGIFDSAFQFMALLTPDGVVIEANQTALSWSRIELEEIVGKPFWLAAPMRDDPALQEAIREGTYRAAAGETVRAEHLMRGAGNTYATVDFSLKPIMGPDARPVWLVAEGRDISELKAAQEALRQSHKMEAMGQLTGGVAHDFNNLLTPIIGSLDMLLRQDSRGERERRMLDGALQSAERAKVLVQRLLAFARRQPLQPVAVDVAKLVENMGDLLATTAGPQVRVAVDLAPELPSAYADANQLEMALLNLGVNARDAMPNGGSLRISASCEEVQGAHPAGLQPGTYVRLSVADTGVGMDDATISRAIEPFFSTKGIGKGTGLGLSMVHGLVSQLGGGLLVSSRLNVGTNIDLWLPASQAVTHGPKIEERTVEIRRAGTVLLVDDEELVRATTAEMLANLGYRVVEAASAEQALRIVEQGHRLSLLITDHLMPGMTGTDLVRRLHETTPDLPALIVSGYAEFQGIASDLPRLTKPFREADLEAAVAQLTPADTSRFEKPE